MIPDDCALAVRDGVVCVVGSVGDSRSAQEETGIYVNDTQYLREFSIRATDRAAPETGWERLERQAGPDGVTTVLIGAAPGEGAWSASSAFGFAQAALGADVEESAPVVDPVAEVDATVTATLYCRGTQYTVQHQDGSTVVTNATTGSSSDVPSTNHCSSEVITNG